jgi:hypothetical protein
LLYNCKAKKATLKREKFEDDPGVQLIIDDVFDVMEVFSHYRFNHESILYYTDPKNSTQHKSSFYLVDLEKVKLAPKDYEEEKEVDEN